MTVRTRALSHTLGDKVEAAYRRGDPFEKRRRLMEDWVMAEHRLLRIAAEGNSFRPGALMHTQAGRFCLG
jgi:hypothetical protein